MKQHKKTISFQTFVYAFQGIKTALTEQFNFRIHTFFALLALFLAFYLKLSVTEFLFILSLIFLVFIAETFNSAIEYLGDSVTLKQDPFIKKAKDASAGAVLLTAILSIIVGLVIFLPKLTGGL